MNDDLRDLVASLLDAGARVPSLGRESLIRKTRAAGRRQDLADAEVLERGGPGEESAGC